MTQRPTSLDPRTARSHARLRDALLELTLEHGWDGVSVQQVCARAGVGRSTFYSHFADREELLLAAFRREHIVPRRARRSEPLAFVGPLIEHVADQRALYNALRGSSCEAAVNLRFSEVVAELLDADLAAYTTSGVPRTAAVRYLTGAFCETLTYWLKQRDAGSGDEVERILKQFSRPVFDRVG